MSFEFFNSVVGNILENSQMSQDAVLTYRDGDSKTTKTIKGMFSSGNYSEDTPSANAPKRSVRGDFFQVSRTLLISLGITEPTVALRKAQLVVGNKYFTVLEVRGALNELITLNLRPSRDPSSAESEDC